ncbi:MAG: TDT family transporter [Rhodospirillales bacterium]|nr:TDT family transporter [Rhodospirillales bacterium]
MSMSPPCPATLADTVREFTPNWFTVTMGTGALALALNQLPFAHPALHGLGRSLWAANIVLFATFTLLYALRWICFFEGARRIVHHPVMSMFFGAVPMGLATIVNGFLAFGSDWMSADTAVAIARTLWWGDAALSVLCSVLVPYWMFTRQAHSLEKMTAVWLLPIVASEVAAASAGLLVPHLPPAEAFPVLMLGYVLWACSVPLALSILVVLVLRLILHKLPDRDMGPSAWLALGPIGTGALALLLLGEDARPVLAARGLAGVGDVAFGVGVIGATLLCGYGAWWLTVAGLKTVRYLREGMAFNLGWWGFTFPLAVYALATLALARITQFALFDVAGTVLVAGLAGFWAVVATRTAQGAADRRLFFAPCLHAPAQRVQLQADAV